MSQIVDAEAIPSEIRFERVSIDPILAQKWLDTRELNIRSVREARVRNDALDMLEGRWFENGDVIRLAPDGELLDGMHRLSAIIRANCRITLWVAFNVPKESMGSIDAGSARSFSDYLKMSGEHRNVLQASVTRRLDYWYRGFRYQWGGGKSIQSIIVLRDLHARRRDDIRYGTKIGDDISRKTQFLRATAAALFFILTSDIDAEAATVFKDGVLDGENLSQDNPISALRRRLLGYSANKLSDEERLAMFINAWNLWRAEKTAETIHIVYGVKGGASSQPLNNANFPVPR